MRLLVKMVSIFGHPIAEQILFINDYLRTENKALRKLLKDNNISTHNLNDSIRKDLSEKARLIHPKLRAEAIKIASPKTVVYKWWQKIKAKMYDSSSRRPPQKKRGRQPISKELRDLVIQIAREEIRPTARNVANQLENLGFKIKREKVRQILNEKNIKPDNDTWSKLLKTSGLWQMDFTTVHCAVKSKVNGMHEVVCYHILLLINVSSRKVVCAGITENPNGQWVINALRSLLGHELESAKTIIMDRDPVFTPLHSYLKKVGISSKKLPAYSPNLNAYIERFHLTLKSECLEWLYPDSLSKLRNIVSEYLKYYNHWRPHQSLGGLPPEPNENIIRARNGELNGKILTEERLNGLIKFRYREAV